MITSIVLLAVLLLLNGVLAMAELAMMTSRRARLQQSAAQGSRGAAVALELSHEPTRFLSTIQVGITLIGIFAGAFGEKSLSGGLERMIADVPVLAPHADNIALGVVVLVMTYLSLVVGELVPKRIALAYPEAVATLIARPLNVISIIGAWPVKLLSASTEAVLAVLRIKTPQGEDVSEDDVNALIARAASTGILTPQEYGLFRRTMRAADLRVGDLMVPRADIAWLDESATLDEVRALVTARPHSHFPVCRGSLDQLVGVVHVRDLFARGLYGGSDFRPAAVAHKPLFVPEGVPALRLLDEMGKSGAHLAIVVDEYGGTQGMVTLNDIAREIMGDLQRKGGALPAQMVERSDGTWLIDGRLPMHRLVAGLELPAEAGDELPDVNTAAGLAASVLGRIPQEGDTVMWQGHSFEVVDMDGMRVDKLLVHRVEDAGEPGE